MENIEITDSELMENQQPEPKRRIPYLTVKSAAFVAIISALGAVLSLSTFTVPIMSGVALDLSHIGDYFVAIAGGPILGAVSGAVVGIFPAIAFGNPAVIPGKMLTGFSVGMIYFALKRIKYFKENSRLRFIAIIIAGIVGYIPEYVFTIWDLNFVLGMNIISIVAILAKAWIEIPTITVLTAILISIPAVRTETDRLVGKQAFLGPVEYGTTGIVITITMELILGINFGLDMKNNPPIPIPLGFIILFYVLLGLIVALIVLIILKLKQK